MSYEVLARKWRPRRFEDVYGQDHVTRTLANAIRSGRLPHAILLAGPRGIGKTTIARIVARELNGDDEGIETGTSLDVQEIDAASYTGVDNVREIRDSIRYAPAPGKWRIFIIDEVHMLSQPAFNALLKTLEEPPPHSLFIFATTAPEKIPPTVLSRVQRFDLKRLGATEMMSRLAEIVKAEELEVPESVLRALVRLGDGSLRDALTLLDRLVAGAGPRITEEDAAVVLDLIDRSIVWGILDPVLGREPAAALDAVRRGFEKGIEPARLALELLGELRNLVVASLVDDPTGLIDAVPEEVAEIRRRARACDPETLQLLFRVLAARQQELGWSPLPAHSVEMSVVRLATLPDAESIAGLIERIDALGRDTDPAGGGGGGRAAQAGSGGSARGSGSRSPERPRPVRTAGTPSRGERQSELKQQVKAHPAVREVIETLDAELQEIRTPEGNS